MRRVLLLVLLALLGTSAQGDEVNAAAGVLHRLLGPRADQMFSFRLIPKRGNLDTYRISVGNTKVRIEASSGVAMCRAAYDYLKEYSHALITWDGDQVAIPNNLPDASLS